MIDGNKLISWGFKPAPWFANAIEVANVMRSEGADDETIRGRLQTLQPVELTTRTSALPYTNYLVPETDQERDAPWRKSKKS